MKNKLEQKQLLIDIMGADAKDGLYKQQTSVSWLEEELKKNLKHIIINVDSDMMEKLFTKAKELDQVRLQHAFIAGGKSRHNFNQGLNFQTFEEYYNNTYEK